PEGNEPSVSKFLDLTMLALQHGGRVRTEMEHRRLFEAAGLELPRVIPTPSPLRRPEGARVNRGSVRSGGPSRRGTDMRGPARARRHPRPGPRALAAGRWRERRPTRT